VDSEPRFAGELKAIREKKKRDYLLSSGVREGANQGENVGDFPEDSRITRV
jgi:hypothetical protein